MSDTLRIIKSQFDVFSAIRVLLFSLLVTICFYQLKQSLDEISEEPTVSVVLLESLNKIRFPTLTICHKTPFTQLDFEKLNQIYNLSRALVDVLGAGSGMLPISGYCNRNYISRLATSLIDNRTWFDWEHLTEEYEALKLKTGLNDSPLMRHILLDFSYPCERNFDNSNFWPPPLDPEPGSVSGQLECKDGFMSKTWSIEKGLCWVVNASVVPATTTLVVFPTVPNFDGFPDVEYYEKYLNCIDNIVEIFVSDGLEAKTRSYFEGPLYVYQGFEIGVSSIKAAAECQDWTPKYLPEIFGDFRYSISNCEADMAIHEYFVKQLNCVPAVYRNPDNLPVCSPVDLAQRHFDAVLRKVPFPKPLTLQKIGNACPQPCAKRRSYTYSQRTSATSERRFHLEMSFSSFDSWLSVQKQQNTVESYFGQIGGLLGLWIGFSVFSLYDYIAGVYRLYIQLRDKRLTLRQAGAISSKAQLAAATLLCSTFGHELRRTSEVLFLSRNNLQKLNDRYNEAMKESTTSSRRDSV